MFIHRIKLKNILSFGPDAQDLELQPLNVLIGPNGSGKSNLIEAIGLLKTAPSEISKPVRDGGGVDDWLWRGQPKAEIAEIEVVVEYPGGRYPLRYGFAFGAPSGYFSMVGERLEDERPCPNGEEPWFYFETSGGEAKINRPDQDNGRSSFYIGFSPQCDRSVLSHVKDPQHLPEMAYLGNEFERILFYREWSFGRQTPARLPQKTDFPNAFLMEDCQNIGLILNRLTRNVEVKQHFLKAMGELYDGLSDFHVDIEYGTVQLFLHEGDVPISAMRLSDGALRYVCLLAILLDPSPPPLICTEEPEIGLHPDILPGLTGLLRQASKHCQLIVTTHSDVIVDSLTGTPESVVVCEEHKGQTMLQRLDQSGLAHWIDKYRLGELWSSRRTGRKSLVSVTVYVEGGGDTRELRQKCRRGFSEFFRKAGLAGRMPRVVSCAGGNSAYDKFFTALINAEDGDFMVLLVDSEGPVAEGQGAWPYLRASDTWDKPEEAANDNAHLMVQCMEAWFLADKDLLEKYFGVGFNRNALPARQDVENVLKADIAQGLNRATRRCESKGVYRKGRRSFEILMELNVEKVIAASAHARRLVNTLLSKTL